MAAKVVPGLTINDIHAILDGFVDVPPDESKNDMTVTKAMEYWGVCENTAGNRLKTLVEQGKLIRTWGKLTSGRYGYIYRIPTENPPKGPE
jgi:predicted transcriptional regulator